MSKQTIQVALTALPAFSCGGTLIWFRNHPQHHLQKPPTFPLVSQKPILISLIQSLPVPGSN